MDTDTEEGTIALHRKKSRRVSFAENTLVHIFDRDDDESDTHPQSLPEPTDDLSEAIPSDDLGFPHPGSDSKDSSQSEQDYQDLNQLASFLHPLQSPSSGSIIGSATSNDEFFGPVSTSFIKPGQLSSSSSSDENNDRTRDSTFFSMHFQSLARSESGDMRTSTAFKLNFDEKTPTLDSAPTTEGSPMVLTLAKKPNVLSSTPVAKSSGGNHSNDMSLVGESPKKYDFGILSPALDANLGDTATVPKSPINTERNLMDLIQDRDAGTIPIPHSTPKEVFLSIPHSTPKEGLPIRNSPFVFKFSDVSHNSSIQKSISRLSMLQDSPFYSTPGAKFGSLAAKSLDSLFENIPPETLMDQDSTESGTSEDREVSIDNLQDQARNIQNSLNQVDKMDCTTMEIVSLPDKDINKFKDLSELEKEDEREINPSTLQDKVGLNQYSPNQDLQESRKLDSSPNSSLLRNRLRSSSAKKRENEEAKAYSSQGEKNIETQKSPKRFKGSIRDSESVERQNEMKHWTDSYSKIIGDTEKMVPLSNENFKLREIDLFEDMLVCTHRSKTYEILQSQLQSKKMFDPNSSIQHKRATETKLELQKVVHEHLKLKLMRAKSKLLLEKVELVESDIQERELIKSKIMLEKSRTIEVDSGDKQTSDHTQEAGHEKTALHHSLETSEGKITNLINFFHDACMLKGDPGCENTIQSVNDHLVKRMQGRSIRQDSQLWTIDSLESRNDHRSVVLNYLGFNTQRLYVSEGPDSYLSSSNTLDHTKINKIYPDMGISTALLFVLRGESTQKYNGPRSLMQETQTSNMLLGNLLDIAEEVQQVQIELRNLTQTYFHLQSAEQLDLQLCFLDFENSRKVTLTLDMSCLKRGVYPSDIVPCFSAVGSRTSESEKLSAEFQGAIHNLEPGFFRIIRICRCLSQALQASSR